MRAHETPRLIIVTKGQGRVTIAGRQRGYGPNNLIFVPPRTMYGLETGPTSFGQILSIPSAMAEEWPEEVVHLRLRDVSAMKELTHHLEQLERELSNDQPGAPRAALYMAGLLAVFFDRQLFAHADELEPEPNPAERLVAAYTDLVERDFQEHLGVAGYAAALGVTPTHLTRCCKQTCGKSALQLLNDRILFEARNLLRNTKQPVSSIASDLGFRSAAYFSRAFQSHTGMTPSAFRERGPVTLM